MPSTVHTGAMATTATAPRRPNPAVRALGLLVSLALLGLAVLLNIGFYLPDVPSSAGGFTFPGIDKVFHAGVFALTMWAIVRLLPPRAGWAAAIGLLLLAHAIEIELYQGTMLPGRTASVADMVADAAGIVLGIALALAERRARRAVTSRRRLAQD